MSMGNHRRPPAVFLDRDGTLIRDAHYLSDPDKVEPLPGSGDALRLLRNAGYLLFLLTNQSGIGRGYFLLEAVHRCNERMLSRLGLPSDTFREVCIAPETPNEVLVYRKPSPRFILECIAKYKLDPRSSWMVGDKETDAQTGINAGIRAALVHATASSHQVANVSRYPTLYDFAVAQIQSARLPEHP